MSGRTLERGRLRVERVHRTLADTRVQTALAFVGYLAFAAFITWPFAIHPSDTIPGVVGGDLTSAITYWRELAEAGQPPFLPGTIEDLDAPDGLEVAWGLEAASFPSSAILWGLAVTLGAIPSIGVFTLLAFSVTALSMFLLVRWLTGRADIGFIAGLAYGFWPLQHTDAVVPLGHKWLFVLLLWRMLVCLGTPTLRNGVLAGAAAGLTMWWTHYWLLIGGVAYATIAVAMVAAAAARGDLARQLRAQAAAALVVAVVIGGVAAVALNGAGAGVAFGSAAAGIPERSDVESTLLASRPLMYVVPDPDNPIAGRWTKPYLREKFGAPYVPEATAAYNDIYVGVSVLALALAGIAWLGSHIVRTRRAAVGDLAPVAGCTAVLLIAVGFVFSAPPRVNVLGIELLTPTYFVNELTLAFRNGARFATLVMLGLCVLAGLGLKWALERRGARVAAVVLVVLAVLVPLDLWGRAPSSEPTRIDYPEVYDALRGAPRGMLVEYPLQPGESALSVSRFYQDAHGLPLFNGYRDASETESAKLSFRHLGEPGTIPGLRLYGVRYLLMQKEVAQPEGEPAPGATVPGLELMAEDDYGALYGIVAPPAAAVVLPLTGFGPSEGQPGDRYRWAGGDVSRIEVRARCRSCEGELRFRASAFARPRTLTVRKEDGAILARLGVDARRRLYRVPLALDGNEVLEISADPPGDSPAALYGSADTRVLSVAFADPIRFVRR